MVSSSAVFVSLAGTPPFRICALLPTLFFTIITFLLCENKLVMKITKRKIPATMATQHPDHACRPYWHSETFIPAIEEAGAFFVIYVSWVFRNTSGTGKASW